MATPISLEPPVIPDVKQTYSGRPIRGTTWQSFAQVANDLAGWRFRRVSTKHHDYALGKSGLSTAPTSLSLYHRMTLDNDCSYLLVVATYFTSNTTATVDVTAYQPDTSPAQPHDYDDGFTWSVDAGTLVLRREADHAANAVPAFAFCGEAIDGTENTSTDYHRPLYTGAIGTSGTSRVVEVTFSCAYTRIYSTTLAEMYRPEV